ncbi:hypothetical protein B0H12DRAFT_148613 [Mycena haematopus]|nr:hypothetical protein B0H12DRAFT_148613 [Mycena haematopus]
MAILTKMPRRLRHESRPPPDGRRALFVGATWWVLAGGTFVSYSHSHAFRLFSMGLDSDSAEACVRRVLASVRFRVKSLLAERSGERGGVCAYDHGALCWGLSWRDFCSSAQRPGATCRNAWLRSAQLHFAWSKRVGFDAVPLPTRCSQAESGVRRWALVPAGVGWGDASFAHGPLVGVAGMFAVVGMSRGRANECPGVVGGNRFLVLSALMWRLRGSLNRRRARRRSSS